MSERLVPLSPECASELQTTRSSAIASRLLDVGVVLLILPVLLPLMGLVVGKLLLVQGRPVLFRQRRAGRGGVTFRMTKLRTMTEAVDASGALLPDEARITRIGRFLRRTRLDEFPEAYHVLSGDMSLVGPRPLLPETVAAFGELGRRRSVVRPGITGWAQVNGNTRLSNEQKIALDLWYVVNRNVLLDIYILALTAVTIVRGERVQMKHVNKAVADAYGSGRRG